ncbi:nucleoside hydrolase [Microseira wollei]|uniref:Inosine/uridine-preferring nucleoside hydrolase n=1 Tax=Microseira wollei NIES-4236 TaxID=2530354 RepID=A0AAV3XC28_9CYAN|nr:nucleoside hydrolase [Microseira wollei]GET38941.1 inosine/uridine-preferring nucleoside hydrolase [Microseira wollei NIES-4236]
MIDVQNQPIPVIVDTDAGVDDALALIMALNSPQLDLKAVTVVAGNINVDQAANNVLRVVSIVEPDRLPIVAKGCEKPLKKPPFNAAGIHGADGLGELDRFKQADGTPRYPQLTIEPSQENAIDVLLQAAQEYGDSLTIIALGPLTNLATAIQKDSATMKKVGRIVIMGGAVTVPGNISAAAEFNFFVDPDAAQIVMESEIPLTLVGLDVAMKAPLPRQIVEDNLQRRPSKVTQFIADCTQIYMAFYRDNEGFYGCYLHDPLAMAVAIDPSLVKTESLYMMVETQGRFTTGMSLADRRDRRDEKTNPPNVEACLDVDTQRFMQLFDQLVLRVTEVGLFTLTGLTQRNKARAEKSLVSQPESLVETGFLASSCVSPGKSLCILC